MKTKKQSSLKIGLRILALLLVLSMTLLAACCGAPGADGKSAYELAVAQGYTGTELEWLASLAGEAGAAGQNGTDGKDGADGQSAYELAVEKGYTGTEEQWLASLIGASGQNGTNGQSAYALAKQHGYAGTELEWLASLAGEAGKDGLNGKSAYELAVESGYIGDLSAWLASLAGKDGVNGTDGKDGSSAYDIAVENGYTGTVTEWLASLVGTDGTDGANGTNGKSSYELAQENGFQGTLQQWLASLVGAAGANGTNGANGMSAYEIAQEHGFAGTEEQWLASLHGSAAAVGKSAYELAVEDGFEGTVTEWLASLKGADGAKGQSAYELAVEKGYTGTELEWLETLVGAAGANGSNGKSAYELAVEGGFDGDLAAWLTSLAGEDGVSGVNGASAYELAVADGFEGTVTEWLASLVGQAGENGTNGASAYELAVSDGFAGSLQDWLASLVGAQGPEGPQGPQGIPGTPGADGAPGKDGVDGAPGKDGVDGAPGKDGVDGAPGKDGVDGAPGKDGVDGAPGADGAPGKDGADGAPGADGADGKDGVSVVGAHINAQMHLILELSNGREIDAGYVGIPDNSGTVDPYTAIRDIHASTETLSDITVKGRVVAIGGAGFLVYDGTGYIYYYTRSTAPIVSIDDTVEITGATSIFGGTQQFSSSGASYAVKDLDVPANGALTPEKWTADDVESYTSGAGAYVQLDLQLFKSGSYYNAKPLSDSSTKQISLVAPTAEALNGLTLTSTPIDVTVTGYICYCSNNKYVYMIAESIVPIVDEDNTSYTLSLGTSFGDTDIEEYSTGNYGAYTYDDIDFEYYRAYRESDDSLMNLMPLTTVIGYETLPGCLYNVEPIYGIDSIEITYQSSSDGYLYTGDDRVNGMTQQTIPASAAGQTLSFTVDDDNFFTITCGDSDLQIISLTISYSNEVVAYDSEQLQSGTSSYRFNPVVYTGELVDGVSTVTVPTLVELVGGQYTVIDSKEYTYYSYDYVAASPEYADAAAMTDPMDVINYYQAFGQFPANYVAKNFNDGATPTDFDTVSGVFDDDTRYVSRYSGIYGYALYVPYSTHNSDTPYYYEFDIALEASYWENGTRGVGRVVAWEDGWDGDSYNNAPVCVYTDDHYATFQEYLNTGCFGPRFDAERLLTNTVHSDPTLAVAA